MSETFVTKIISDGRLTIPETIREILKLKEGDPVRVSIEKATEA